MTSEATHRPRITVVSGGRSTERERSLLSGHTAHASLRRQGYNTTFLDTADPDFLSKIRHTDVAFLAIAGQYAEDGKLQGLLELLDIPYTGSGVLASAVGMHKTTAKTVAGAAGVPVLPQVEMMGSAQAVAVAKEVEEKIAFPVIIKPQSEGGSIGMAVCRTVSELIQQIDTCSPHASWFMEPFTPGTPATCAILEIDGRPTVLPVLETLPTAAEFYDYATKRDENLHRYRCPATLPEPVTKQIADAALTTHEALGCRGYSRSDFIVTDDGRVIWLEVNTLPGLSETGNFATIATAAGMTYDTLIRHILATATTGDGYRP